jgi:hypothetical protein
MIALISDTEDTLLNATNSLYTGHTHTTQTQKPCARSQRVKSYTFLLQCRILDVISGEDLS